MRIDEVATIVSDSIGVELIDIAVAVIDSMPHMTMKIARLARNTTNVEQSRDSVSSVADVESKAKWRATSEQETKVSDNLLRNMLIVCSVVVAAYIIYRKYIN